LENKPETANGQPGQPSGESRDGNSIQSTEAGPKPSSATKPGLWPRFYFLGDQLKWPDVTTPGGVHINAGQKSWQSFYQAGRTSLVMVQAVIATIEPLYHAKRQV
jgi:hypothetical protein